ncbi:MAG: sigma-54-dependent Fis family transcriptional regulator [Planctomycetes bacterium]|nr:sigma-54-dependent Fis family transcriptional regulator [Planctomycetota bacterium]
MATILIIEDEENLRFSIKRTLEKAGHDAHEADSIPDATALMQRYPFDALITDINLGGETGIDLIRRLHDDGFDGAIIVITAFGTVESAVEAMKLGADEYLQKPLRLDELVLTVDRLLSNRTQLRRLKLYDRLAGVAQPDHALIGTSPAWLEAISLAERLAQLPLPAKIRPSNSTTASAIPSVLLLGPTGCGKGLLARRIHDASPETTDTSPFVHVNCALLPPTLVESELFGHEKGAFTDAHTTREGFFEMADGGTIFLDEIGDMPLALQAKILTVVEEGTFRRVGGGKDRFVRARLIAATNQNLAQEVRAGNFRQDLFYRLNPFTIELPPLCERGDDAILIAEKMLQQFAAQFRRDDLSFASDARDAIRRHSWPGNVRELINAVQRAAMLSKSQQISAADLGLDADQPNAAPLAGQRPSQPTPNGATPLLFDFQNRSYTAENVEKELMIQAIEHARGNVSKAARLIGMQRSSFRYRIERFGLEQFVQEIASR